MNSSLENAQKLLALAKEMASNGSYEIREPRFNGVSEVMFPREFELYKEFISLEDHASSLRDWFVSLGSEAQEYSFLIYATNSTDNSFKEWAGLAGIAKFLANELKPSRDLFLRSAELLAIGEEWDLLGQMTPNDSWKEFNHPNYTVPWNVLSDSRLFSPEPTRRIPTLGVWIDLQKAMEERDQNESIRVIRELAKLRMDTDGEWKTFMHPGLFHIVSTDICAVASYCKHKLGFDFPALTEDEHILLDAGLIKRETEAWWPQIFE